MKSGTQTVKIRPTTAKKAIKGGRIEIVKPNSQS